MGIVFPLLVFIVLTSPLWVLVVFFAEGMKRRQVTIRFFLVLIAAESIALAGSMFIVNAVKVAQEHDQQWQAQQP